MSLNEAGNERLRKEDVAEHDRKHHNRTEGTCDDASKKSSDDARICSDAWANYPSIAASIARVKVGDSLSDHPELLAAARNPSGSEHIKALAAHLAYHDGPQPVLTDNLDMTSANLEQDNRLDCKFCKKGIPTLGKAGKLVAPLASNILTFLNEQKSIVRSAIERRGETQGPVDSGPRRSRSVLDAAANAVVRNDMAAGKCPACNLQLNPATGECPSHGSPKGTRVHHYGGLSKKYSQTAVLDHTSTLDDHRHYINMKGGVAHFHGDVCPLGLCTDVLDHPDRLVLHWDGRTKDQRDERSRHYLHKILVKTYRSKGLFRRDVQPDGSVITNREQTPE